jgi:transposase-like protein
MRQDTLYRKKATGMLRGMQGKDWWAQKVVDVIRRGKRAFDAIHLELGRTMAEAIMLMERENMAGPDWAPLHPNVKKWASERGSVYLGDQKVKVARPRLRVNGHDVLLPSYLSMKDPGAFSEELLTKVLAGLSQRRYADTVVEAAKAFGVSAGTISNRIVEITAKKLKEFKERSLSKFKPFAIYLDTIHRGGEAFIVALGISVTGKKRVLGFWQGATENSDICEELMADLERRGLKLSKRILFITDGGAGIIKWLRDRFGKKLIHVRCAIHKCRNIQKHLAKKYRKSAAAKLMAALEQNTYADARQMLMEFERWLRKINESAADSLREAMEELLTLHRLKVPKLLRKTLYTTNPIESMFSMVRDGEANIKRYQKGMYQRWLGAVLLHCEEGFTRVKGYRQIQSVVEEIKRLQAREQDGPAPKLAA